jgi:hypothetical protein
MTARALLLAALALPGPALAQAGSDVAATQTLLGGVAPPVCRIGAPQVLSSQNATFQSGSESSGQVSISQLSDLQTGAALPSRIALSFPAICNHTHLLVVRSAQGGLARLEGPAGGDFASRVDYRLAARWAGASGAADLAGAPQSFALSVADGADGFIELDLQAPGGGPSLVAGTYQDQVVVEFTAAP